MENIITNKKAFFDYEILKKYQAGIVLTGPEVKSIKSGKINLGGSFVVLKNNEVFLLNADVAPYQPNNLRTSYEQKRSRKLLLRKGEIKELIGMSRQKGLTMVPLRVYNQKGLIKVEFAVVRGKQKIDKREKIKKREVQREIQRTLKH